MIEIEIDFFLPNITTEELQKGTQVKLKEILKENFKKEEIYLREMLKKNLRSEKFGDKSI